MDVASLVGVTVAVVSLVFAGWQARLLSRQTGLQNATAGSASLQQLMMWLHDVQKLLLVEPRLLQHFSGRVQQPDDAASDRVLPDLTSEERARLGLIVTMFCDVMNIGLAQMMKIPSADSIGEWRQFCLAMLDENPLLFRETMSKPVLFPELIRLINSRVAHLEP